MWLTPKCCRNIFQPGYKSFFKGHHHPPPPHQSGMVYPSGATASAWGVIPPPPPHQAGGFYPQKQRMDYGHVDI